MTDSTQDFAAPPTPPPAAGGLADLARLFLRLGATAFGGPAAHIALMEDEVVRRRGWLSRAEFLDLLGAANLIPGPNSTELAIHIGHLRAGRRGLLVAGSCFILPAFAIVLALAWAYVRFGQLPAVDGLLYGVKPVVVAVIAQALWRLGRTALTSRTSALLAVAALVLAVAGVPEVVVLFGVGAAAVALRQLHERGGASAAGLLAVGGFSLAMVPYSLPALFLYFLFVGSVLFGSGYLLVALLQGTLVQQWGWLTEDQLLTAVAIGQVTPGPVFTTATFVGYLLGGFPGGMVATVGIFLPAFFFVWASAPWIPRLRASPRAAAFLDGVNVAAVALILLVTVQLGRAALVDPLNWGLALGAAVLLFRWNVNSAWVVLGGAVVGVAAVVWRGS